MSYLAAHTSIVMVGDSFIIGAFDVNKYKDLLGEIDSTRTIVTPVIADYSFVDSAYHIQVQLNKIQLDYRGDETFPDSLLVIAKNVAEAVSHTSPAGVIRGIGINLNVVVPNDQLGKTGAEFCSDNFLSDESRWSKLLRISGEISTSGRLVFDVDSVKYTFRFEPHYKSGENNLFVDANGHQKIEPPVTPETALEDYHSIAEFINDVLNRIAE